MLRYPPHGSAITLRTRAGPERGSRISRSTLQGKTLMGAPPIIVARPHWRSAAIRWAISFCFASTMSSSSAGVR